MTTNQIQQEPEVYLLVLNVMLFEMRAEEISCARNISLDCIGLCTGYNGVGSHGTNFEGDLRFILAATASTTNNRRPMSTRAQRRHHTGGLLLPTSTTRNIIQLLRIYQTMLKTRRRPHVGLKVAPTPDALSAYLTISWTPKASPGGRDVVAPLPTL